MEERAEDIHFGQLILDGRHVAICCELLDAEHVTSDSDAVTCQRCIERLGWLEASIPKEGRRSK